MGLPSPRTLPHGVEEVPYTIVGDDAFALKPYMMKPFSQKELTTRKREKECTTTVIAEHVESLKICLGLLQIDGEYS